MRELREILAADDLLLVGFNLIILTTYRCADGSGLDLAKHRGLSDRVPARPKAGCSRSRR